VNIPTEDELVDADHIEAPYVCGYFLGKTADDAYEMYRSEDFFPSGFEAFSYLAVRGLAYYLIPAVRYLESSDSAGNRDFARGLLSSLSNHLYSEPIRRAQSPHLPAHPLPREIVASIRHVANYLRSNLTKFGLLEDDVATSLGEIEAAPPQ
jgi:hypothetical protein